jgi:hypothetical protein
VAEKGRLPSFADTRANGEVAPKPAIHGDISIMLSEPTRTMADLE